jgi:hypothetical protein
LPSSFKRPLVILWIVLLASVMWGELLPSDSAPIVLLSATDMGDKLLHYIAYAVLVLMPAVVFGRRGVVFSAVGTELLGIVLELLQQLVPGRTCEPADV